jgi:hypothetical protein
MSRLDGAGPMRLLGRREAAAAAALLFAATLLAPGMPFVHEVPHRDSGVFLYVAERILSGDVPYRDVWDHKPPGVYYLNALALLLPGPGGWGVWLLSVATLASALGLSWRLLSRAFGPVPALVATALWPLILATEDFTNYLELYALPLQFGVLALFWHGERRGGHAASDLAIGALAGGLLLLRPNLIGVPLAVGIVVLVAHRERGRLGELVPRLGRFALGALAVLAPVAGYFLAVGAFGDLLDQAFTYNVSYAGGDLASKAVAAGVGWIVLASSGASVLVVGAAAWLMLADEARRGRLVDDPARPLLAVAAVGLPLEVLLASVSGQTYAHYYLAWLAVLAVLMAWAVGRLWRALTRHGGELAATRRWAAALAVAVAVAVVGQVVLEVRDLRGETQLSGTLAYLRSETEETDAVLIWGAEAGLSWASDRESPVRLIYQYPLVTPGYSTPSLSAEFVAELERRPPALVIDASEASAPSPVDPIPPIALRAGCSCASAMRPSTPWAPTAGLSIVFGEAVSLHRDRR